MANLPPIPASAIVATDLDPVTGRPALTGQVETDWYQWFLALFDRTNKSAERLLRRRLVDPPLEASIAPTALPLGLLTAGLYRVTWRFRVTRPATTSSELSFTLGWTEGAVVMTRTSPAKTGNTVSTEDNDVWTIRIDQAAPVTYATTYASVGGVPMQYELEMLVESLPA